MSSVFGNEYSGAYDALYHDKDYSAECDLIARVLAQYGSSSARRILDLGCGTGGHAILLAERGYEVVGVDRSESMLARAKSKAADANVSPLPTFYQGDVRSFDLSQQVDAVTFMFAVLGYQTENDDVVAALRTARRHLRPGGLVLFDVWYGPAVMRDQPSDRVKVTTNSNGRTIRIASGKINDQKHTCAVNYELWNFEEGRGLSVSQESHLMRFFFPQELRLFLDITGFKLQRIGSFPDFEREPDAHTWNVFAVATAFAQSADGL